MVDSEETADFKKSATHWLFAQPANTTALYLILITIGYSIYYLVTIGVPRHLEQIHQGYKEIAVENREAHKMIAEKHTQEMSDQSKVFERSMDKYEKSFADGVRAASGFKSP